HHVFELNDSENDDDDLFALKTNDNQQEEESGRLSKISQMTIETSSTSNKNSLEFQNFVAETQRLLKQLSTATSDQTEDDEKIAHELVDYIPKIPESTYLSDNVESSLTTELLASLEQLLSVDKDINDYYDKIEYTSTRENTTKFQNSLSIEEEPMLPSSTVSTHALPIFNDTDQTFILYMSCSQTYIYVCTNQHMLYYAKLTSADPIRWQRYSEMCDVLAVSESNRSVCRVYNKKLYIAKDPLKIPPVGIEWECVEDNVLSVCIEDYSAWYIKEDEMLYMRLHNGDKPPENISCPFQLRKVVCCKEKVVVTTFKWEILIRIGCNEDCPEGDGWIIIDHSLGAINDFLLAHNSLWIIDNNNRVWFNHYESIDRGFIGNEAYHEMILPIAEDNDELEEPLTTITTKNLNKHLICHSRDLLCLYDTHKLQIVHTSAIGVRWQPSVYALNDGQTRLQRLIYAYPDEDIVWALRADGNLFCTNLDVTQSYTFAKPLTAQHLTHASFVPNSNSSKNLVWALDESCNIYVRSVKDSNWLQLDQTQFDWTIKLVHLACNSIGVWAVDNEGCIHFRYGHSVESSDCLSAAWIEIPGHPANEHRYFLQVYCSKTFWMVWAIDNKQCIYVRKGITEVNPLGKEWNQIPNVSAIELAISDDTVWILTSLGYIQKRNQITFENPSGNTWTTLPEKFHSLTASSQNEVWTLASNHQLVKLEQKLVQL
ncbi:unnamed protein product, partial [Didymodactylos carnosus]